MNMDTNHLKVDKTKIDKILSDLRQQLQAYYGARLTNLVLYGSQARGDASFGSDIDVLVVLEGTVDPLLEISRAGEITAAISLKYDVVISCVYVSEERYTQEKSPLLLNIHQEGVLI